MVFDYMLSQPLNFAKSFHDDDLFFKASKNVVVLFLTAFIYLGHYWQAMYDWMFLIFTCRATKYTLQIIYMQSRWHKYIKKTLLGHFSLSKQSMKVYFNFRPLVGNPTTGVKLNRYKVKMPNFTFQIRSIFFW